MFRLILTRVIDAARGNIRSISAHTPAKSTFLRDGVARHLRGPSAGWQLIITSAVPARSCSSSCAACDARGRRARIGHVAQQLKQALVKADDRMAGVVRRRIDLDHIFHGGDEILTYFGDAPLLFLPGLELAFFKSWRIVSGLHESTKLNSTA